MFNVYIKLQYGLTQTGFALVSQESTVPEKKIMLKRPNPLSIIIVLGKGTRLTFC